MANYLNRIECRFADTQGRPLYNAARDAAAMWPLRWMYEHYATPLWTKGISTVNICFVDQAVTTPPNDVLGIVDVAECFDLTQLSAVTARQREQYCLDRLHGAMLRCATCFDWDLRPLAAAYQRVIAEDYHFAFFWKKPRASPDRKIKAQAWIDASPFPARLYLIFFDRRGEEQRRILLSVGVDGPGIVRFLLDDIRWDDPETVRVTHQNGRDYWLCTTDGQALFHYPRAENGDPHGEYDLGRMYYDGQWILQDQARGLALIQSAADKGFLHAQRFLANLPDAL